MEKEKYLSKTANVKLENKALKFIVYVIGVVTLVNAMMIFVALQKQRTILVPVGFDQKVSFSGTEVSPEYILILSKYVINNIFTYTPDSARSQFMEVSRLFAAENYAQTKEFFLSEADKIETSKIVSIFTIHELNLKEGGVLEIRGNRIFYTQISKVEEKPEQHTLKYRVNDGKFEILEVN